MEYDSFRAMNSEIVLAAEGAARVIAHGMQQARAFIEGEEARFTRFSETSELSRLNRSAGTWFEASTEMFDVLRQACLYAEETSGLFDPSVLNALEFAGYDRSMDEIRVQGARLVRSASLPVRSDFRAIEWDATACAIRLPRDMRIDLGGIAKGWIAEQAAHVLARCADACAVNAGGDLFTVGLPSGETTWEIGLEDPRESDQTIAVLNVAPGAVATSSIAKRRWQQGDQVQHHLIDPRRAVPAETDWLSVTVIAPHATTAEVYAKALLIGGSQEALHISAKRSDITFIAIDSSGQLWGPAQSREMLNVHFQYA